MPYAQDDLLPRECRSAEESSEQIITTQKRQDADSQKRERDVLGNERLSVDEASLFTKLDGFPRCVSEDAADDYSESDFVSAIDSKSQLL